MVLVTHASVGAVAWGRMVAAGTLTPLTADTALPADVPVTPTWRAMAVADHVPAHTVLSGAAGLWVHCGGHCPEQLVVVGKRGLHRTVSQAGAGGLSVVFHSGPAHDEPAGTVAGIHTASPERCAVDALRWDDHRHALPAVVDAVRRGQASVSRVADLVGRDSPLGVSHRRLDSAWTAVRPLLTAPLRTPGGG